MACAASEIENVGPLVITGIGGTEGSPSLCNMHEGGEDDVTQQHAGTDRKTVRVRTQFRVNA